MEILFWICLALVIYTYLGYGIIITVINRIKRPFSNRIYEAESTDFRVSLIVPCFNEGDFIVEKIKNTFELDYPSELLEVIFVTDGTSDHSLQLIAPYRDRLIWMHEDARKGKAAAMNRATLQATGEILVFCDANTYLNKKAIKAIVAPYKDTRVGAVSGEKRIMVSDEHHVSGAGEGLYWKYESWLKRMDSELYSLVGAAGELMSYRKDTYRHIPEDSILDDFIQSMTVALDGYRVVYRPESYAMETASANVSEEWKRKIRIAAGGWQSIFRLKRALIPWPYPWLTFSYISHRLLRWSLAPLALVILLVVNPLLVMREPILYGIILLGQVGFYALALLGYLMDKRGRKVKFAYVAYYFTMMNLAVFGGFIRFLKGTQKSTWERVQRA